MGAAAAWAAASAAASTAPAPAISVAQQQKLADASACAAVFEGLHVLLQRIACDALDLSSDSTRVLKF